MTEMTGTTNLLQKGVFLIFVYLKTNKSVKNLHISFFYAKSKKI